MIQLTAMTGKATHPQVAAIVLAAGGSARMGQTKQLLTIGGQPMVRRVTGVVCAAGLAQVIVVVGAQAQAVADALIDLPVEIVTNQDWAEGMSTSLKAGLAAVRPEAEAVLVILADQPGLSPALLQAIVSHYHETGAPIVAPVYQGRRGNPVLWDRALFAELQEAKGDKGGRVIIDRYRERVARLPIEDSAVHLDVDTHDDYVRAQASEEGSEGR